MAAQNDSINVMKANMAAQNDKIIAQDDTINELKASMAAQDDTINVLKANMAARDLSRSATIEKLEAKILAQGGIIKTLEAANMDVQRQHTLEIEKLNTRLTESNEELAEKLTAHSAEIEKLQNDNKEQQKCIRVLMLTFATSSA